MPIHVNEVNFFNDKTGSSGKEISEVEVSLDNELPIFKELKKIILGDDILEESQYDPSWKQMVLKNKHSQEDLERLYKNRDKAIIPQSHAAKPKPKFEHSNEIGAFAITDKVNKKRLETQSGLLSNDSEQRGKAVRTLRGTDETYTSYQGAILKQFIFEERQAILGLIQAAQGASAIFSLERGGAMIADLMERLTDEQHFRNVKIPKPSQKDQKQVHMQMFKKAITDFINSIEENVVTIAISETAVGGGSGNSLVSSISDLCNELKNSHSQKKVKFKILIARETIKNNNFRGAGVVKINDPVNIGSAGREGVKPVKSIESSNPNDIELFFSQTRYLIGEDVDYQLQYSGGPNSDKPVIVFEENNGNLVALAIEPAKDKDSARDILIDLIGGAYDDLLKTVFPKI